MIKGDIDLTENLDFYHDKEDSKSISTRMLPWKKDTSKNSITWNIDISQYFDSTTLNYAPISNSFTSNEVAVFNSNITYNNIIGNSTFITTYNIDYNNNLTYYPSSVINNLTISYTNEDGIIYQNYTGNRWNTLSYSYEIEKYEDDYSYKLTIPIFGERKHKKSKSIVRKYCYECQSYYYLGCKCSRTNMISKHNTIFSHSRQKDRVDKLENRSTALMSRILDNINYHVESTLHPHHLVGSRNRRYASMRSSFNNSGRKIPWLRKLNSRIYDDYIDDLFEEKDYSHYLTDMDWIGM